MNFKRIGTVAFFQASASLTCFSLGIGILGTPSGVLAQTVQTLPPAASSAPIAQNSVAAGSELGCRQTNAATGIYTQPYLDSTSRGLLNPAETVRLESKGEGWARINAPVVGWVEARYLSPPVACENISTQPDNRINNLPPESERQANPPAASSPTATNTSTNTTTNSTAEVRTSAASERPGTAPSPRSDSAIAAQSITCNVLPADGLVVRSEPMLVPRTYLATIPPGTHDFRFTRNTQITESEQGARRWVYIIAPTEGWISLGVDDRNQNLGGNECG
ncbi:MAG: hypothetical protein MUF49_21125 [Oculatellaceae cyanobacterium Prado106]|jgi:hypothetical protein|nr:hypothetical protein [Oculatellaceae cyanobacterium Prado106]